LCGRGREAPKSLEVLGVIEASADIGRGECACVFCLCLPASSFCRPRREGEGYTCRMSMGSSLLPPDLGENSWSSLPPSAVEHGIGRGRRPMAPVISMTVTTERTVPALDVVGRRGHRSPWSCPGQEPYRVRGSSPMPAEGPAGEKSTRVGGTVSRWCQASPHRAPRRE